MSKSGTGSAAAATPRISPPRMIVLAAGALVLTGLAALVAALDLFGLKGWLFTSATKANKKLKPAKQLTDAKLHQQVDTTIHSQVIATVVLAAALTIVAISAYRGRYWARWAVLALWVLSTFTGTLAGFASVVSVFASAPLAFKAPAFVAGAAFVVAVVLTSLRPSVAFFNANKPARTGGPATARRGMFSPRTPPPSQTGRATTRPAGGAAARTDAAAERSRAKQRANADAVAKGAELARSRAKASKSRRSGV